MFRSSTVYSASASTWQKTQAVSIIKEANDECTSVFMYIARYFCTIWTILELGRQTFYEHPPYKVSDTSILWKIGSSMRLKRQTIAFFACERAYPRYPRSNKYNYYFQHTKILKLWPWYTMTHKNSQKRHSNLRLINVTKPINFPPLVMCWRGGKRASLSTPGPSNWQ